MNELKTQLRGPLDFSAPSVRRSAFFAHFDLLRSVNLNSSTAAFGVRYPPASAARAIAAQSYPRATQT